MVEGQSPYKLAPGVRGSEEADGDEESSSEDAETGVGPGTVFRLARGQLRQLEGGMDEYEEIAGRTAARLAKARN